VKKLGLIVLDFVLEWAYRKVARFFKKIFRREEIKREAKESVKPLKEAQTGEEIDAATDDALSGM
jgi:hypothetical protein